MTRNGRPRGLDGFTPTERIAILAQRIGRHGGKRDTWKRRYRLGASEPERDRVIMRIVCLSRAGQSDERIAITAGVTIEDVEAVLAMPASDVREIERRFARRVRGAA